MSRITYGPHENEIRSILIWGPNWIGDVVLSLPVARSLKKQHPKAGIAYALPSHLAHILSQEDSIDRLIPVDVAGEHGNLSGKISLVRNLRKARFDLGIAVPNSFRAAFMLYLSGAKRRVGYASDSRGFLLTDTLPARSRNEEGHRVDYFLRIAQKAGCESPARDCSLKVTDQEKDEARALLEGHGIKSGDLLIALHPCASKPPRTLSPGRFAEVCKSIRAKWPEAKILLLGSGKERGLMREVRSGAGCEGVFFIERDFSLRVTLSLLDCCRAFIGADSGLMHIAAAVGTPVVGIFGPGVPEHTGPVCDEGGKAVIFHPFPCAPCRQRFFSDCDPSPEGRPPCIEKVSVEEVVAALDGLL